MSAPWETWIPGVLNSMQLSQLIKHGLIKGNDNLQESVDRSSFDLSVSGQAWKMTHGSVKPRFDLSYRNFIENEKLADSLKTEDDGSFLLNRKTTYVFKTCERLDKGLGNASIHGQATAKSSIGRLDVLVRLIVDGMGTYEHFSPKCFEHKSGDMFLEVTPITFDIRLRPGDSLSQLRLCVGPFHDVRIRPDLLASRVLKNCAEDNDGYLSVQLSNEKIGALMCAAFSASPDPKDPIPISKSMPKLDPTKYWERIAVDEKQRIEITKEQFYILRSKELIALPGGIAVYCRASDETIGEMRIHYAGFVHPWFGLDRTDTQIGTPLIFELRGHQVNVSLANEERLANLEFYRMSEDAPPVSKDASRADSKDYAMQTLKLSKYFADWPTDG